MSSSVRSVRSLTFTFPRTARVDAQGASHSFGSTAEEHAAQAVEKFHGREVGGRELRLDIAEDRPRPPRQQRDFGPPARSLTRATTTVAAMAEAATTAVATVGRSTGRRSPKAVAEDCAAKSEASSCVGHRSARDRGHGRWHGSRGVKDLGRGVNPARVPVVLYPQGV